MMHVPLKRITSAGVSLVKPRYMERVNLFLPTYPGILGLENFCNSPKKVVCLGPHQDSVTLWKNAFIMHQVVRLNLFKT